MKISTAHNTAPHSNSKYPDICEVCDYIIIRLEEKKFPPTTIRKLYKLLYYCQGYSLSLRGRLLFREHIQAWRHGPVVPEVRDYYVAAKEFADRECKVMTACKKDLNPVLKCKRKDKLGERWSPDIKTIIDRVIYDAGHLTEHQLSRLTHEDKPWAIAFHDNHHGQHKNISTKLLKEYFSKSRTQMATLDDYKDYYARHGMHVVSENDFQQS